MKKTEYEAKLYTLFLIGCIFSFISKYKIRFCGWKKHPSRKGQRPGEKKKEHKNRNQGQEKPKELLLHLKLLQVQLPLLHLQLPLLHPQLKLLQVQLLLLHPQLKLLLQ